jgi:hypothetical protein
VLLSGCLRVSSTQGEPVEEPRLCVVTMDSEQDERLEVELVAPDRPSIAIWYRDEVVFQQYTYSYDEGGRLLEDTTDYTGATSAPDGVADYVRRLTHSVDSVSEEWQSIALADVELASYALDASDNQTTYTRRNETLRYQSGDGGRLKQVERASVDVDTQETYTTTTVWTYDPSGLPIKRTQSDSRSEGLAWTVEFTYVRDPGVFTVTANNQVFRYEHDGDQISRIVVTDSQASSVMEYTYTTHEDRSLSVKMLRDAGPARLFNASQGCGMAPELPTAPKVPKRPGATWQFIPLPAPIPFE